MPSLKDNIIKRLGGFTGESVESRTHEAYRSGYSDSGEDEPVSGTTAKYGYRRQTTDGLRDFTLIDPETVRQIVWVLWQSNPIIKRGSQIKRDYIIGRGVSPSTKDEKLQKILDHFWELNDLPRRQKEFTLQLFLFGEQCYPAFVRKTDGRVKLGYIDPDEIERVITHPENALEPWAVLVKPLNSIDPWVERQDYRVYRIIRKEEKDSGSMWAKSKEAWISMDEGFDDQIESMAEIFDPEKTNQSEPYQQNQGLDDDSDTAQFAKKLFNVADEVRPSKAGKYVTASQAVVEEWEREMLKFYRLTEYSGSCFYFSVNTVSNQPRGVSDFLQVADWVDQHDVTLFALADREQLASYFSWDVTLNGADDKQVTERSKKIRKRPPKRGSVNVHNDAEVWDMTHPDIGAQNSIETARALQLQVLGGMGYPEHWFGKGDETNRATAEAQGDPTWKTLQHDQGVTQGMFLKMCEFVKDQAEIASTWEPSMEEGGEEQVDHDIDLVMPEMTAKDTSTVAGMLGSLASALVVAEDSGWHDRETSREIWAKGVQELGLDIDTTGPMEEPKEDEGEEQGFGEEKKSYFNQHGVMLPDEERSGSETWEGLGLENQSEVFADYLDKIGYSAEGVEDLRKYLGEKQDEEE